MSTLTVIAACAAVIAFNVPILLLIGALPLVVNLRQALMEKSPIGGGADATSYCRVTGLVGAVVLTSFFWAISNVVLLKASPPSPTPSRSSTPEGGCSWRLPSVRGLRGRAPGQRAPRRRQAPGGARAPGRPSS
ncbi:MAG TPA: hypothetical protein VG939_07065 [Caulobacteraceae bacterium]|nr:hypothetical protein [Caulobacteraceae bacterium]